MVVEMNKLLDLIAISVQMLVQIFRPYFGIDLGNFQNNRVNFPCKLLISIRNSTRIKNFPVIRFI